MILKSLTEPHREIDFDTDSHVYADLDNATTLVSGTTWCKQFKEPFDAREIANKCENDFGWGVPAHEIRGMWSMNGSIAAGFGTAVHEALEYWERYKALGAQIQKNKRLDRNKAYPNHPMLYRIIRGFEKCNPYTEGEVIPEAFVSYKKWCGQVDRVLVLDWDTKRCRIQDYKVNGDANKRGKQKYLKQFSHLPDTKMTGYQMQMSFYAQLMSKAGWTVEGLDAFVLAEHWSHHAMPVLDLKTGQPSS